MTLENKTWSCVDEWQIIAPLESCSFRWTWQIKTNRRPKRCLIAATTCFFTRPVSLETSQSSKSWKVLSGEEKLMLIQETKSGEIGQRCTGQHSEVNGVWTRKIPEHNDYFALVRRWMYLNVRVVTEVKGLRGWFYSVWLNAWNIYWILPFFFAVIEIYTD